MPVLISTVVIGQLWLKIYNPDYRSRRNENDKIVSLFHPTKIEFKVTDIREETASAKTIRLTPEGGYVPPFLPGQYINIQVDIGGIHTSRPYSISSSCVERGYYEITAQGTGRLRLRLPAQ